METSQVKPELRDAQHLLQTLPIQSPVSSKSVMDFVVEESADSSSAQDSPAVQKFLTTITAAMYVLVIGALIWMTVSAGKEYLAP